MQTFFSFFVFFLPAALLASDPSFSVAPSNVIAEVDGKKITLGELEAKRAERLFQAQNTYYQAERKVLDDYIGQTLLEEEARRENVTVDKLLEEHVIKQLPKDPSDESLRVYYEGLSTTEPFEAVRGQILTHIRQTRIAKAKIDYVQSLHDRSKVLVSLAPPKADISLANTPIRGGAEAPVMVIEFADYECPYCQKAYPTIKRLQEDYKGKVAFAYKDSPLPMHAHAEKASEAASCAGAQGKYWQYHDMLFESKKYDIPALKDHAHRLNLDQAAFDQCLDTGKQASAVQAQFAEFQKFGLDSTPAFFINGRFLSGAVDYPTLRSVVDQELAAGKQAKESNRSSTATNSGLE